MDKLTREERSERMSRVKGKDTKPEWIVRKFLHSNGLRYRLHDKLLPGRPDIKLSKYQTIIFINGCFWHGHSNCHIYQMPKSNTEFWNKKIAENVARDKKKIAQLKKLGWKIFVLWECQLKKKEQDHTLISLLKDIKKRVR